MKNYDKTGGQPGKPGYRTPSTFKIKQHLKVENFRSRSAKPFKTFGKRTSYK